MYWKNLPDVITTDEKLLFLEELLEKNASVQAQFVSRFKRESITDLSLTKE